MKRLLLSTSVVLAAALQSPGQSIVWHSPEKVVDCEVAASTGLSAVYVAPSLSGVSVGFTPSSVQASSVKWYRFSSAGAAYAEQITAGVSVNGSESVLSGIEGNTGYIVEDGDRSTYFWVIDYTDYPLAFSAIAPAPEQDCTSTALATSGSGAEMPYYTINGRRMTLSRDITLEYSNLEYDGETNVYNQKQVSTVIPYLQPTIHVPAVLCSTTFTLTGDRFLREWGRETSIESQTVLPHAVECQSVAAQEERTSENETGSSTGGDALGGSAPCVITFEGAATDAAIFHEWQFSRSSEFDDLTLRISDLEFTYTFTEEGSTFVRLYCANDDASCDSYGPVYEVSIGQSMLKCPNAFSPFNQDGVNDEWKVTYSSIVSFSCTIFNRYGKKMVSFGNPGQGWDGKYGGKFVPAGVYYYVIEAKGADGKDYKLSGDINILDYKQQ